MLRLKYTGILAYFSGITRTITMSRVRVKLRFLREIDEKTTTVSKDLIDVPEIAQALALAEESAYTPGELNLYESYWGQVSREKTLIMDKYAAGKAEIAINMLKDKEPLDKISRFTGLSQEAISRLKSKL